MNLKAPVLLATLGLLAVACPNGATLEVQECDVPAIFEASCSSSRCHEGTLTKKPDGELDLFLSGLEERLVTSDAEYPDLENENCPDPPEHIVSSDPDKPEEGLMWKKLVGKQTCGESMPPAPYDGLSTQQVSCIQSWLTELGKSGSGLGGATGSGGSLTASGGAGTGGTATGGAAASGGVANAGGTGGTL